MDSIWAISGGPGQVLTRQLGAGKAGERSFKETLVDFLEDVNRLQQEADESVKKLVKGEVSDIHQVMVRVEEAEVAFQLLLELRNKVIEAYQELMRMQV